MVGHHLPLLVHCGLLLFTSPQVLGFLSPPGTVVGARSSLSVTRRSASIAPLNRGGTRATGLCLNLRRFFFNDEDDEEEVCLPQDEASDPRARAKELTEMREEYAYTDDRIPVGTPYLDSLPDPEFPPPRLWIAKLAGTVFHVVRWLGWYNFVNHKRRGRAREAMEDVEGPYDTPLFGLRDAFKSKDKAAHLLDELAHTKSARVDNRVDADLLDEEEDDVVDDSGNHRIVRESDKSYRKQFRTLGIDLPHSARDYQLDEAFCRYRLAGPYPMGIRRATAEDRAKLVALDQDPSGAYTALKQSIDTKMAADELFVADFGCFAGVKGSKTEEGLQKYACSPLALFGLNPNVEEREERMPLEALGIQLFQEEGAATPHPIFTKEDGVDWDIAKACFTAMEGAYHEGVGHLGECHLVCEAFIGATRRHLPSLHPLNRLLLPHLQGSALINEGATRLLAGKDQPVDALMGVPIEDAWTLITERTLKRLSGEFSHQVETTSRGMEYEKFPYPYPYRDDADKLNAEIETWVTSYLQLYYGTDQATQEDRIGNDSELQEWVKSLADPSKEGGKVGWMKEWGATEDKFKMLSKVVSSLIFTASARHAAVNFPQRTLMTFTPAYPLAMYSPPPREKDSSRTKADFWAYMPPLTMSLLQLQVTQLLGGIYYSKLGEYEDDWFTDPEAQMAAQIFEDRIAVVAAEIEERNDELFASALKAAPEGGTKAAKCHVYETLLPWYVPRSINI